MRTIHHINRWTIGQWQFFQIDAAQISNSYAGRMLFGYADNTEDASAEKSREWFNSLEHAMAAAIAEKYTGPRGAGGSGVGTAADWFMRMIGADQLVDAGAEGRTALAEAMNKHRTTGLPLAASRVERELESQGLVLAKQNPR